MRTMEELPSIAHIAHAPYGDQDAKRMAGSGTKTAPEKGSPQKCTTAASICIVKGVEGTISSDNERDDSIMGNWKNNKSIFQH